MSRFLFRLALALGMTIGQLKREMSSLELASWIAYDRISPIGPERGAINQAIQTALIANAHRKKGARSFKPGDFMPFHPGADGKARTAEQMKAKLGFLARMSKPKES